MAEFIDFLFKGENLRTVFIIVSVFCMFVRFNSKWEKRFASLEARMSAIEAHISVIEYQITALKEEIADLKTRISSLEGHMTALREEIASLKGRMTLLEGRMTVLEEHMKSLEERMTSLEKQSVVLDKRMTSSENVINWFRRGFSTLNYILEQRGAITSKDKEFVNLEIEHGPSLYAGHDSDSTIEEKKAA